MYGKLWLLNYLARLWQSCSLQGFWQPSKS